MENRHSRRAFSQTCYPRGFTLIELLVVVLIIGILAAIALPQYQKAVAKSRMVEAITIMDANAKDAQAYLLANGELGSWAQMVTSYADKFSIQTDHYTSGDSMRFSGDFGKHFQIGCGDPQPKNVNGKDTFYCIKPKNGDKAYIYHWIDNMGNIGRSCSGDDCGKYITEATCFYSSNDCYSGDNVIKSGCTF